LNPYFFSRVFLTLILFFHFQAFSQNIPDPTNPPRLVNDFADVLSDAQEQALEQKLIGYEDSTSNQVAIVLVKNLDGDDVADYAVKLALKWGIGSKKNNGVLLLAAIDDKKSRIEVGYGLEGVLTDLTTKRILTEDLKPSFKQSQYYEGLDLATTHIIQATKGEYKGEYQYSKKKKKGKGFGIGFLILVAILIIVFAGGRKGGGGGGGFLAGMLLGQLLNGGRGGRGSGGFGDFSSGGGSFGGFGGGSFGGGGSSGDW